MDLAADGLSGPECLSRHISYTQHSLNLSLYPPDSSSQEEEPAMTGLSSGAPSLCAADKGSMQPRAGSKPLSKMSLMER